MIPYVQKHSNGISPIILILCALTFLVITLLVRHHRQHGTNFPTETKVIIYLWCGGLLLMCSVLISALVFAPYS
jgi:uncharacterized membrane protein YdcZ (DUF606 family)